MSEHEKNHDCHDCHDDCGCETDKVILTMDDDTEMECDIVAVFEAGGREYIALSPVEDGEILLYRYIDSEEGADIEFIDTDEEYNVATQAFYDLMEPEEDQE